MAILLIIFLIINLFIYEIDQIITPNLISYSEIEMKARALDIINTTINDEYSKQFNYNEIITIVKDNEGSIELIQADTLKLNKIACDVALKAQKKLREIGSVGIKIPIGIIFKNNLFANLGPNISIKMLPMGAVETKYISEFESEGINQTRHKMYVEVTTEIRVYGSTMNKEFEVKNIVPIAETIIVGKTPNTILSLGLDKATYKTSN